MITKDTIIKEKSDQLIKDYYKFMLLFPNESPNDVFKLWLIRQIVEIKMTINENN